MSRLRIATAVLLIALTAIATRRVDGSAGARRVSLGALPYRLATWSGRDSPPIDADTARELAADSYLMRRYTSESAGSVDLYIAYYGQQRPGISIHSPLHCLPATGWEPLEDRTIDLAGAGGTGRVRRLLVQKALTRAVVLYWYAVHGRMLDGEVASKLWLLHDAVKLGRTDAALIRVVVPVEDDRPGAVESAEQQGVGFVRAALPYFPFLWS